MNIKEFKERMENRTFFEKHIKYLHIRSFRRVGDFFRGIKFAWQRVYRGYDDSAYWGLDLYITEIALPVLKSYRENGRGLPWNHDTDTNHTEEEWHARLDKMILAFELLKKDDMCELDYKSHEEDWDKIESGLKEFGEYFNALWD